MSNEVLILRNLSAYCPSGLGESVVRLLDNVNIVVNQNDVLGLIGETNAGKSVLIDAIGCNPKPPLWVEGGELLFRCDDRLENLLEKDEEEFGKIWGERIGFIPSNARDALNPILTIGRQFSNIIQANSHLSREEADERVIEMFKMVQMPDPKENFNSYPNELSGGMAQRVVISVALSMSPKLLLADEPTMGLDVTIQRQVLDLMASLLRKLDSSAILATRDLGIVANYCSRVAVMCNGRVIEFRDARGFFKGAVHPYSRYLLEMAFASRGKGDKMSELTATKGKRQARGENNCHFVNGCPLAEEVCWLVNPSEKFISANQYVRCHKYEGK